MRAPAFSVVVVARNEARTLPVLMRSLETFLAAGGELVVVDTGSEDDTVRVAREGGARVEAAGSRFHSRLTASEARDINARFAREGEGPVVDAGLELFDFGRARQFAGGLAAHEFVWQIDGSDVVASADFEFLDAAVRSGRPNSFGYLLSCGGATVLIARFFDRRLYAWRGRVHEAPFRAVHPMPGTRVSCTSDQLLVRHDRQDKTRNYLPGLALDAIADASTPRWKHYLGRELWFERRYHSAIAVLREHADTADGWAIERGQSCCLIGDCLDALERPDDAAESYFRATRVDSSRRQPFLKLASLCQRRGDFHGSVAFAAAALTLPRSTPYVDMEENSPADPHAILYWGLFWLGRRDEARSHWEICRRLAPDDETFAAHGRLFAGAAAPPAASIPPGP